MVFPTSPLEDVRARGLDVGDHVSVSEGSIHEKVHVEGEGFVKVTMTSRVCERDC